MQYSKAMGAETWAISTSASKEAEARRFGASHFLISTVSGGSGTAGGLHVAWTAQGGGCCALLASPPPHPPAGQGRHGGEEELL
jgi:hypothetical protein